MSIQTETVSIDGPCGRLETCVEYNGVPRGIALVAHPHPLGGGNLHNKVAFTLARALLHLGYVALRPNFRGVGASEGQHDGGSGEVDDLAAVLVYAQNRFADTPLALPLTLAGFSFGAYCQAWLADRLRQQGQNTELVLVGMAVGGVDGLRHYEPPPLPAGSLLIHGAADETVPLNQLLAWAERQDLPVTVIAGADHFFHRRLHLLRAIIVRNWSAYG